MLALLENVRLCSSKRRLNLKTARSEPGNWTSNNSSTAQHLNLYNFAYIQNYLAILTIFSHNYINYILFFEVTV